jgi:hypothetical protein
VGRKICQDKLRFSKKKKDFFATLKNLGILQIGQWEAHA